MHLASPLGGENHNDPKLIPTAKAGVTNVFSAAIDAGVKKIVMTSSAAAVFPGRADTHRTIDENFWTDIYNKLITNYMRSKVVAERTAWDIVWQAGGNKTCHDPSRSNFRAVYERAKLQHRAVIHVDIARCTESEGHVPGS